MIEEIGLVVAVLDAPPGAPGAGGPGGPPLGRAGEWVQVRTERRAAACGACAADGACSASILDRLLGRRPVLLTARNAAGAGVGDRVAVAVSEGGLVRAALAVYLLPVAALVGGALVGESAGSWLARTLAVGNADLGALAGASVAFTLALVGLRRYSAALARDPGRHPVATRRLTGAAAVVPIVVSPGA